MIAQRRIAQSKSKHINESSTVFQLKCVKIGKLNIKLDFKDIYQKYQYQQGVSQQITTTTHLFPKFAFGDESQVKIFSIPFPKASSVLENKVIFQRLAKKNNLDNAMSNDIMRAKPTSTYCQVCRQHFDDYFQHIQHQNHQKRVGQSTKSCKMISDLISDIKYQPKRPRSQKLLRSSEEDHFNKQNKTYSSYKIRVIQSQNAITPIRLQKEKCQTIQASTEAFVTALVNKKQQNSSNFFLNLLLLQ